MSKPSSPTSVRRHLLGDPEFPFWTLSPSHGHVVAINSRLCVVTEVVTEPHQTVVHARILFPNGEDSLSAEVLKFNTKTITGEEYEIKVLDRMYYMGEGKPYSIDPIDYSPLYGSTRDHSDKLSEDNPLRHMPYWNSPGGKNLTIIACLEWAFMHLTFENNNLPCAENRRTLAYIQRAIELQKTRQSLRQQQNLIGSKTPHDSSSFDLDNEVKIIARMLTDKTV